MPIKKIKNFFINFKTLATIVCFLYKERIYAIFATLSLSKKQSFTMERLMFYLFDNLNSSQKTKTKQKLSY